MNEYVSQVKKINYPVERVYAKLSDLSNLNNVKDKIPANTVTITYADKDSCKLKLNPIGESEIRIIDREENKTVKLEATKSPIPFNMWIQLVEKDGATFLRLTLRAELNMFIKKMIGSKLEEGIDKLADTLAMLPY
ncbi:SRPBCC family protein [Falsiporphyromonas endometrii]|uniref:SRPBCC family protein n=1 Tax=Falsiporphyromonas endometrii TaxID=1387297 RepID=A0ABV9K9R0_9PORP|nr:SRPBCC family protein [Porphyromonadaceae bacterium]